MCRAGCRTARKPGSIPRCLDRVVCLGCGNCFRRNPRAIGSVVERLVHTEEVTGSNPVSPTQRCTCPTGPLAGGTMVSVAAGETFEFRKVHHVQLAIPVGGEEVCRSFWRDVLALDELNKPPALAARGGCWFRGGGLEVHLGVEEDFVPARKAHPGILVRDLPQLAHRLENAGVAVLWDTEMPGFERFYAADPFGNRLEFMEQTSV